MRRVFLSAFLLSLALSPLTSSAQSKRAKTINDFQKSELGGKRLTKQGEFALGAPLVEQPKPASRQRLDGGEQRTRAKLFVLVMLFGNLAFAHRPRQQRITNQETGSLVKAHNWIGRIVGQRVERQDLLQARQKGCIDLANAPGLLQMRL